MAETDSPEDGGVRCCPICADAFSAVVRSPKACSHCHEAACKRCVERYILATSDDPHCMFCKHPWSSETVDDMLTRNFRNGRLREHRANVLFDRERSMMPATQTEVEYVVEDRKIVARIAALETQRRAIQKQIGDMRNQQRVLRRQFRTSAVAERRKFVKPCVVDGCRGFLSTQYRCGVCSAHVCPKCHERLLPGERGRGEEEEGEEGGEQQQHQCDPGAVQSVALIASDSRPCPKCGSMIFRVSGCNHMFCTAPGCATAFDWVTGNVMTSQVHNPHYYEYMRQRTITTGPARDPADIPCGGMPTVHELLAAAHRRCDTRMIAAHRSLTHVTDHELRHRYRLLEPPDFATNKDLRIRYMLGELCEQQVKKALQEREKGRIKNNAVHHVLSTVSLVGQDMFRMLLVGGYSVDRAGQTLKDLTALREHVNASLRDVSRRFGCTVPQIADNWDVMDVKAAALAAASQVPSAPVSSAPVSSAPVSSAPVSSA